MGCNGQDTGLTPSISYALPGRSSLMYYIARIKGKEPEENGRGLEVLIAVTVGVLS